jgi:hypothetical protein
VSRSGYVDYYDDHWQLGIWRGQVASAIRGRRGQAFLRELIEALDALPEKRLIRGALQTVPAFIPPNIALPQVCAIGAVGVRRGIDLDRLDQQAPRVIADALGIAHQLVSEIEYMNDDAAWTATPESRWHAMRAWAIRNLREGAP